MAPRLMKRKQKIYSGSLETVVPNKEIHLDITHLIEGYYTLKIVHKNKVIGQMTFKKNQQ